MQSTRARALLPVLVALVLPAQGLAQQRPGSAQPYGSTPQTGSEAKAGGRFGQPSGPGQGAGSGQQTAQGNLGRNFEHYILGDELGLEIVVHALGEVQRPGEYRVPDDTNVLELLSKAGGGTPLADLGEVRITHQASMQNDVASTNGTNGHAKAQRVVSLDLDAYLESGRERELPVLQPGDVVTVPRNKMAAWKTTAAIMRDLAVVASTYLLYVRVTQ